MLLRSCNYYQLVCQRNRQSVWPFGPLFLSVLRLCIFVAAFVYKNPILLLFLISPATDCVSPLPRYLIIPLSGHSYTNPIILSIPQARYLGFRPQVVVFLYIRKKTNDRFFSPSEFVGLWCRTLYVIRVSTAGQNGEKILLV